MYIVGVYKFDRVSDNVCGIRRFFSNPLQQMLEYKSNGHFFQIKEKLANRDGSDSPSPRSFFAWLADNQDASNDEVAEAHFFFFFSKTSWKSSSFL